MPVVVEDELELVPDAKLPSIAGVIDVDVDVVEAVGKDVLVET
ncbi:12056_t:CDS:1, partial [Acaulospora colombiana]